MKRNQSGFTLVEIIVSLLIASIVMGIAGTLILNSMGYFSKTAVSDVDKQALDGINNYVYSELIYASEVKIDTKKPDGDDWHWLYIKDNRLWRDTEYGAKADAAVFLDEYYNSRKLTMSVKGFESYRMDIKYTFQDTSGEQVYSTKNTLELLNLKVKKSQSSDFDPFSNVLTTLNLSGQDFAYKIYYKKGGLPPQETNEDSGYGTVEDQLECPNAKTAIQFVPGNYKKGDIVIVTDDKGVSYKYMNVDTNRHYDETDVINSRMWKKLDRYYNPKSAYLLGDIVINPSDGKYYLCVQQIVRAGDPAQVPGTENGKMYWDVLTNKPEVVNKRCTVTDTDYSGYPSAKYKLVTFRLETYHTKYSSPEELIQSGSSEAKALAAYDGSYWQKIKTGTLYPKVKDDKNEYSWTRVAVEWDPYSAYLHDDLIWYNGHFYIMYGSDYIGTVPAVKNSEGVWVATGAGTSFGWKQVFLQYGIWTQNADPYKDK